MKTEKMIDIAFKFICFFPPFSRADNHLSYNKYPNPFIYGGGELKKAIFFFKNNKNIFFSIFMATVLLLFITTYQTNVSLLCFFPPFLKSK